LAPIYRVLLTQPRSPLFPYTTLFRSQRRRHAVAGRRRHGGDRRPRRLHTTVPQRFARHLAHGDRTATVDRAIEECRTHETQSLGAVHPPGFRPLVPGRPLTLPRSPAPDSSGRETVGCSTRGEAQPW